MQNKLFRWFFVLILFVGLVVVPNPHSVRAAGSWYVSTAGNDADDCSSPATPCATINGAIGKATGGDTINVAVGTYTGTGSEVVLLDKDATLSGGWDASFTTQSGISTIDGQVSRRGIFVNSNIVVTIEYFVIQNGFFDGAFNGGGGIRNDGNLTVSKSAISNNSAINCGEGGNIYNTGTLTVNSSSIQNGSTVCGAGGLENSGTATLSNSNVNNNNGVAGLDNNGGTITLINSTVSGTTGSGLGINNFNSGSITLNSSSITMNVGAGILIQNGTLTVNNSSVHNNSGGGIYVSAGATTINNSTVSSNGEGSSSTGGIYNEGGGTLNLNSSTVTSNMGTHSSAAGGITNFGTITLRNTILARNTGNIAPDCAGTIGTAGYNLVGNTSICAFSSTDGDLTNEDPKLGQLIGLSEAPKYHPLLSGSPAIDMGDPAGCTDQDGNLLTTDQRGVARVGTCDIGAYEYTSPGPAASLSVIGGDNQSTGTSSGFPKPFQAAALDSQGSPVSAVTIDFTAPASGPSGTFADLGTNTTLVDTNEGGVATTSIFTANDQAGAYTVSASAPGLGSVNFRLEQFIRPANDNFAKAEPISLLPFSVPVDITDATNEQPIEPQNCYSMDRTVWYSFTPAETIVVRATSQDGAINGNVNIYRAGSGISDLQFLSCTGPDGFPTFIAEANQTYYLQAGSAFGEVGGIRVTLEQVPPPVNDNFANATASGSLPSSMDFDTTAATFQNGEPVPSCAYTSPPYNTIWFAFTPSQDETVSTSANNYNFSPFWAIYSGSSLDTLAELGCSYFDRLSFRAHAGRTYYIQIGGLYGSYGTGALVLETAPAPQANFYYYPTDPSKFDNIQFQDNSSDPANIGIQSYAWNFGDGTTATVPSPTHKYAADGNYQVTHSVTSLDGRTGSITQTVQVRTHDVAIARITTPNSANVGQTKTIAVTLRNIAYPETVQIDLYKSTANGFVWVATVTKSVPALSGNRTTAVNFSYTFTSDDARLGKVTFKAVASIVGARDAYPSDNEAISSITRVAR